MSCLNFRMKPSFECADDDLSDADFVWVLRNIGGWDTVEEFVSCDICPLAFGVSFERVKVGVMPVTKLKVPLPGFVVAREGDEDDIRLLARIEMEARVIVGSYTPRSTKLAMLCQIMAT
jgi:hypothetical protein